MRRGPISPPENDTINSLQVSTITSLCPSSDGIILQQKVKPNKILYPAIYIYPYVSCILHYVCIKTQNRNMYYSYYIDYSTCCFLPDSHKWCPPLPNGVFHSSHLGGADNSSQRITNIKPKYWSTTADTPDTSIFVHLKTLVSSLSSYLSNPGYKRKAVTETIFARME